MDPNLWLRKKDIKEDTVFLILESKEDDPEILSKYKRLLEQDIGGISDVHLFKKKGKPSFAVFAKWSKEEIEKNKGLISEKMPKIDVRETDLLSPSPT